MHGIPSPVLSHCMGINPLLIFYKNSPHCHSARESIPCIVILNDSQSLFFLSMLSARESFPCIVTVHGNQSPFSFSIKTPHTVTVHGNHSPALSYCMIVNPPFFINAQCTVFPPLHCHSAWESIPFSFFIKTPHTVTVHGNHSPALSYCVEVTENPPRV